MRRLGPAMAVRDFKLLWLGLLGMGISLQMLEVAIGWQVYTNSRSALDLGLIGLAEFVPMFLLALPAGHLADRFSRRIVFGASLLLSAAVGVALALVSAAGVTAVWPFIGLALAAGTGMALGMPAARALPVTLVPHELVESAMTLRSAALQGAMVLGPALGGLVYPLSPSAVYGLAAIVCLLACASVAAMHHREDDGGQVAPGLAGALAGLSFVRHTPIVLGAILLDLLAVLFGGAVALLPLFAQTILHVGPTGLGILRSAPAVGALLGAAMLTRRPLGGRAGRTLLVAVCAYGASMVVFGLSRSFVLSLLALAVSGFVDMFSMNIRATTVALATPDAVRGRVLAVEMVFISASNQLGAFESGLAAFLLGGVPAVVLGGALTIAIALGWGRLFPDLAGVDRLRDLHADPEPVLEPV